MSEQNTPDGQGPGGPGGGGPNPWIRSLMIWGGVFLALLLAVSMFGGASQNTGTTISYSDFRDRVASGTVKEVQISDDRIESEGFFQYADDRSRESYTLKLSDGGKRLTLSGDGFEPFEFRKCATIREAHLIPSEYEGTWSTYGTCKAAAESLIKIAPTKITWQGKTSNFTKVHYAGPNAIELEDDGQEEPYGIVLDQGGKSGALVGPGHSPIPLTRCGG